VTSLILQTVARVLQPLMVLVSLFLLLRGHNEPGGGFVGGLMVGAAWGLRSMAFGADSTRASLRVDPRSLIGWGSLLAVTTAVWPLALGKPLFTALWLRIPVPGTGTIELGSPLAFDAGVYLVVAGAALSVLLALDEEHT
jgi:multicomponent Na+:H+ antiporter subunit B